MHGRDLRLRRDEQPACEHYPASGPPRSVLFGANDSTIDDGRNLYAYDARGRMMQATSAIGATAYQVNALGQRLRKTNAQGERVFSL